MNSSARAVLGVLLLGVAVPPVWGGCEAQRAFVDLSRELDESMPAGASVSTDYHRGWLRSRAETTFRLGEGEAALELVLHHRIVHGPLPLGELLEGSVPTKPVRAIVQTTLAPGETHAELAGAPPIQARTRFEIGGLVRMEVESPPVTADGIVWEGVQGTILAPSPDFEVMSALIELPSLEIEKPPFGLSVRDVTLSIDTQARVGGMPVGTTALSVAQFDVRSPDARYTLRDLSWEQTGETDLTESVVGTAFVASLSLLDIDGQRYGPGRMALRVSNLDVDALRASRAALGTAADPDLSADEAGARAQAALEAFAELMARSPEITLEELRLASAGGELEASARVGIDGDDPSVRLGPLFALTAIEGEADVFVPTRLFHRFIDVVASKDAEGSEHWDAARRQVQMASLRSEMIQGLLARGLVVRRDDGYRTSVEYRDGALRINGQPADPSAFVISAL